MKWRKKFIILTIIAVLITAIIYLLSLFSIESRELKLAFPEIKEEKRGVFLSYLEYQSYFKNHTEQEIKKDLTNLLDTLQKNGFNMLITHVRPFSDAIYPSDLFPSSNTLVAKEGNPLPFDFLDFLIKESHQRNIEVHAWINPYRIRNDTDGSTISPKNPCYKWLGSDHVHIVEGKGIFYNPASEEVRKLVLSGVEEILKKYDVDGIHYDDYFYPDKTIDLQKYGEYQQSGGKLSLEEYRLEQVNQLIKETYQLVHSYGKVFGVSPEGNIENNYSSNYADTKRWMSEEGYIDYIMPQIYFGFYNERKPFYQTVKEWSEFIKVDSVKILPALAFYKVGSVDEYALSGKEEWKTHQNIIMRQIIVSRGVPHYQGFSIFRYEYLFGEKYETESVLKERESLQKLLLCE